MDSVEYIRNGGGLETVVDKEILRAMIQANLLLIVTELAEEFKQYDNWSNNRKSLI